MQSLSDLHKTPNYDDRVLVQRAAVLDALPELTIIAAHPLVAHYEVFVKASDAGYDRRVWWPVGDDRPLSSEQLVKEFPSIAPLQSGPDQ